MMVTDMPKESTGPIRRFPNGFWTVFNQWWHGEFTRQGQRPSSKNISKWHAENAMKVWGDSAVSYAETQRHANRMKCRRTTGHLLRQATADDDDDEEYPNYDVSMPDAADASTQPLAAAEKQLGADGSSTIPTDRGLQTGIGRINFDANSDPPGALRCYMNADSDLPAPAAPCREAARLRPSSAKPGAQAPWMQPDPVSLFGHPTGLAQSPEACISSLSWNSSFCILKRPGDTSESPVLQLESVMAPAGNARAPKRCRDGAASLGSGVLDAPDKLRPTQHMRVNPFGEVAAAAAAAAGFPRVTAMPAARDAAWLLNSAAMASPLSLRSVIDPRITPAWLQRAGQELDVLLQDLGITQGDGGKLALPALMRKPRSLTSCEPLRLPEPSRKRDLDSLLRRGLARNNAEPAAGSAAPLVRGATTVRGPAAVVEELLQGCGAVQLTVGDDGESLLLGRSSWATGPAPASGAGLLTSIDCMPLEALLL